MTLLGYSTGAIALGDFRRALSILSAFSFQAVELSALRLHEVEPLVAALPHLNLAGYDYISFHAPSSFSREEEPGLIRVLSRLPFDWPIILHPDTIHNWSSWRPLSSRLAIENMDRRKGVGRSAFEMELFFNELPDARMCLDLGHARQVDSSMVGAYEFLKMFADRIVQLHISEVDTFNRHDVLSAAAIWAFGQVRQFIPVSAAIIVESRVEELGIRPEAEKVQSMLRGVGPWFTHTHRQAVPELTPTCG